VKRRSGLWALPKFPLVGLNGLKNLSLYIYYYYDDCFYDDDDDDYYYY
jgi:hypothetical protein